MYVNIIKPSGFCYGVKRSLKIVYSLKERGVKPIYIYGMLIHNKNVIEQLAIDGIITIKRDPEIFKTIKGTVVFSAHGIDEVTKSKARAAGLEVVDATCLDVKKTLDIIKENPDKDIAYIGVIGHPEAKAALQYKNVKLITKPQDLDNFHKPTLLITQTTMSVVENQKIYDYAKKKNNITVIDEICSATRKRQEALINAKGYDIIFVVGDRLSNNTNTLAKLRDNTILIETYHDICKKHLKNVKRVGIIAGASTSDKDILGVYNYLNNY